MTETEERDLRALGEEIAAASTSPWQPACIARAFVAQGLGTLALTLQGWIDLDAARSPLLVSELPGNEAETAAAFAAFGLVLEGTEPEEALLIVAAMERAIATAFAASLPMAPEGAQESAADDGFGAWAPVWACLVTQCGLDPDAALRLRVDRAFILIAAHRRNQGWHVAGTPYALRDIEEKEAARG